ncbi:MAG: citrate synthase [Thermoplasmata archaeon]
MDARRRGLEDVVIGQSSVSWVGGETGQLGYRGYDISDVVGHLGYEATAHLLIAGTPPARNPPAELLRDLASRRVLPASVEAVLDALDPETTPMDALRTGISALGADGGPYPPTLEQGLDLIARAPTLVARFQRRRQGQPPVAPSPELGHVANFLRMIHGTEAEPLRVWALESYFDIVADHGMNASTFALRVVLSTNSDLLSAATAAVGALKGPLHGGAPERVLDMLDRSGETDRVEDWIAGALSRKERLMGFGHRAYKVEDPRALLLRGIAGKVADPARFEHARRFEEAALAELRRLRPEQRLNTNVEFYAALVLEAVGLPRDLFPPTFAVARTAGWVAHALEQARENRLIRPEVEYNGPSGLRLGPEFPLRDPVV